MLALEEEFTLGGITTTDMTRLKTLYSKMGLYVNQA